ncbi:hypothetical protein GAP32_062 [Cronobacter phage vB_CsaM_GAP32]|uniref:Uncharacterized protein n=1 Tax=Cronobacter phage vB_CsaM_GAP32 TaxID=1141136 RepID=K4F9F9_9CAUD|nr:hypothetical protein GAP32_062 [Cronobacter phage vB_CsaM_GAP32]AFC21510.1 hypothetical protein GAP32_062 [Cronobacter phage vB_CsaM_GAP32]
MNKSHSGFLKAITGVVLISKDGEDMLCCLEDMQSTKHFTIGQIFTAVRVLYGKSVNDYGTLWPKFRVHSNGPISNDWIALQQIHDNCESDYEFLVAACEQLKEEVPDVVPRAEVEKQLQVFKGVITDLATN